MSSEKLYRNTLNKLPEYWKSKTVTVIWENLSPTHWIILDKLSLKNLKLYKVCMGSLRFLPLSNFAVFDGRYFLCYCLQRAANCSNLQTLSTFEFNLCVWRCLLWVNMHANEQKCKQWYQQKFSSYSTISHTLLHFTSITTTTAKIMFECHP